MPRVRDGQDLETTLGYVFGDRKLLDRALTHASVRNGKTPRHDNERLEFVGDRVLGLAVAEHLSASFPAAEEGELARGLNRLVRGETCARVARNIDLGRYLVLSESEAAGGGRDKDTILADAIEAVLGAVFLEAGFAEARAMVLRLWETESGLVRMGGADPKSALQEWAQGRGLALPEYAELAREGPDHAPRFTAEVRISGTEPARGEGSSKRAAEQAAASALLAREGVRESGAHD